MQDVKLVNLELFYDVITESNEILFEEFHKPYFDLLEMTINNMLEQTILQDVEEETEEKLTNCYHKLEGIDFTKEDIRKAMQSVILLGFKEMGIPNGYTTPDTLGIFIAYLISKMVNKKEINILDPMCGTGNLLFTISNYLEKDMNLFAVDNDQEMARLTKLTADILDTQTEIYLEDMFSYDQIGFDAVVLDMPHKEYDGKEYFPYKALSHVKKLVSDNGCLIAILENDFFNYDSNQSFKNDLLSDMSIVGLVELPNEMFKTGKPKIILALQKRKIDNPCFMVKLPNFTDANAFGNVLRQVEMWFEKNKNED